MVGGGLCFHGGRAQGAHAQDAPAGGDHVAVGLGGPGMKYLGVGGFAVESVDDVALVIGQGITARGHDHAQRHPWIPLGPQAPQGTVDGGTAHGHQIRMHAQHDGLSLRIAAAAIVFQHPRRTVRADHDSGVQETNIVMTFLGHAAHRGYDDLRHDACVHGVIHHRGR